MSLDIIELFKHHFPNASQPEVFFAPGRVNLIGEHIDYNGGYVFPAAISLGITLCYAPRQDSIVNLKSKNIPGEFTFDLSKALVNDPADEWSNYPKGVFAALLAEGKNLKGADLLFSSNLPDGAGLSSSAAIEVVTAYAALEMNGYHNPDLKELALLCQRVENKFIGVNCGIMDQFSVANSKKNTAIQLDCETLNYNYAPLELGNYKLVIMNTNKRRELAESKYNERRSECEKSLVILNQEHSYKNLCEAHLEDLELITDPILQKRSRHVIAENNRVLQSIQALKNGDLIQFGKYLNDSHFSLRDDYEVTGIELDSITNAARNFDGCLGTRMTGAGFGGCAIALVEASKVEEFQESVDAQYHAETGLIPAFYICDISDGVHKLS